MYYILHFFTKSTTFARVSMDGLSDDVGFVV